MQGSRTALALTLLVVGGTAGACAQGSRSARSSADRTSASTDGHDGVARSNAGDADEDPSPLPDHEGREADRENTPPGGPIGHEGNQRIRTFDEAKRALIRVYDGHYVDTYCDCPFERAASALRIDLSRCGFANEKRTPRAERIEWEHAVPAAAFGHTFVEWSQGTDACVDAKGRRTKGRACARRSAEFSRIEADLHNLFPVVGEINGLRGDLPMGAPDVGRTPHGPARDVVFAGCATEVRRTFFVPRPPIRGDLARAYKYMDRAYPDRHLVDDAHRAIFDAWDAADPPDAWERERNRRIAAVQGNGNPFVER